MQTPETRHTLILVQTVDAVTRQPISGVDVELLEPHAGPCGHAARGQSGADGLARLVWPTPALRPHLLVRLADRPETAVDMGCETYADELPFVIEVSASAEPEADQLAMLAEHWSATRRVQLDDIVSDLLTPEADSVARLLGPGQRVHLIRTLEDAGTAMTRESASVLDLQALRQGQVKLQSMRNLTEAAAELGPAWNFDLFIKPERLWTLFPWSLPDDQSYRDYLRSVFVLFAHQQKDGAGADGKAYPAVVERQLRTRFHQDFRTADRTETPLNKLLVPLVGAILTAGTGSGFGFGLAPLALPAQGTRSDREQLDALLALAPVSVEEFSNRYRLPLTEPDSTMSSPVLLNVHTLSRVLSDTAQGPVEPRENVIVPQLPGAEGKPILWAEVVGSAPFFLRYDEWLARQQPFYPENLFALRTQVIGTQGGPWLDDNRRKFLEFHQAQGGYSSLLYSPYFDTLDEVHRSARFLLAYGAADAKLTELVQALDKSQYATALRLADEAELALRRASPQTKPGEDWEPEMTAGNFSRPVSFARRRKLKVTDIVKLTGKKGSYPPDGFEQFYRLATPIDFGKDVVHFRIARDQATRLRTYQEAYVLPMLRAAALAGMGDLPGTVDLLARVTGCYIGIASLGSPAGMVDHPDSVVWRAKRAVDGRLRWNSGLGDRPYTARLMYDDQRFLDGPFPLTRQVGDFGYDVLQAPPPMLHPLEERMARIVQADALLAWGESLYRSDDAANLERARELYKAVIFLHGEDPGTSAFRPNLFMHQPWFGLRQNPRVRNQLDRARLALQQLQAGLNFYGYRDDAVPTLRYDTLVNAAQRWTTAAKSAQFDFLTYLGRAEQLDLDMLAAKAQERRAQATVAISQEQIEIAKAGVVVAKKLVGDVEKQIAAKQAEIADANSIFSQFSDFFKGMSSGVSSMIDVGKGASDGWSAVSTGAIGDALGLSGGGAGAGGAGGAASSSVGLGSAVGGLGVLGGYAAFVVLGTTSLQGMATAANRRQAELLALTNEALPAAHAAVRVQERHVSIAHLQAQIATTELAYARDLVAYQNERFLNRDFWDALAGVARRSLHRHLDLAGQAAWFAERALAYQLAAPIRIVRIGYFDARMRDAGGPDRLALDLAELEATRLSAARVTVPLVVTVSLARDLPLAFGQLKATGRCSFALDDADLLQAHPGTFAHRIRAVDVVVDAPGTPVRPRGLLANGGFSLLRRAPGAARVPLLRYADAHPVSEFRLQRDMALMGLPGEQLMPFEGTAYSSSWTLALPTAANATSLERITDVQISFFMHARYEVPDAAAALPGQVQPRGVCLGAHAGPAGHEQLARHQQATRSVED